MAKLRRRTFFGRGGGFGFWVFWGYYQCTYRAWVVSRMQFLCHLLWLVWNSLDFVLTVLTCFFYLLTLFNLYQCFDLIKMVWLVNRPGVAGPVLRTPLLLDNLLIDSVTHPLWKYLQNTFTPKRLKFLEKVHLPPPVTCHMPHIFF